MLDAHGWVSVAELIIYVPALFASVFICTRHGFRRGSGWIYTLILCLIRIIGAICRLVSYHDPSTGLYVTIAVLDSVGLNPLLLATLGLLSRFVDFIHGQTNCLITATHIRVVGLVTIVGLILSIAGGTSINFHPDGSYSIPTTSKAGVALYCVSFIAQVGLLILTIGKVSYVPSKERRVPFAVMIAMPFILVRLIYSILSISVSNHHIFGMIGGNVVVWVCMSVIEEIIVIYLYVILGFTLDKLDPAQAGPIMNPPPKVSRKERRANQYEMSGYQVNEAYYPKPSEYGNGASEQGVVNSHGQTVPATDAYSGRV
ncbi:hypothetical protein BU24DRAFT_419723 [Aaosphaeria arxii CBS 175.79]|uniref:DUF7702 domain-containing protein n=1 Tax=Aaosphaeria arxii CBS 175.79 TaxID=1450172 RepID=A0A6A5Y3U0_9PLEO|nr:uncharacterized protein BU24DRAFT_419723 [Aaosphaeria arxii CBS 175.79]KAF2020148.1 hypothetical protein BU24DRAFT_419723 [Aaosphaeria arxii CBS 175.79]